MTNCRRTGQFRRTADTQERELRTQAAAVEAEIEDMPMNRYVNSIPERLDEGEYTYVLRELRQSLDNQNEILVEILAALRALGEKSGT